MVNPGSIPGVVFVQLVHRIHPDVGNCVLFLYEPPKGANMQIKKDTIYFINHETIERFIDDVLSSGLLVRDDIRSKTDGFGELIYEDKRYVPMSFRSEHDYVYYSSENSCKTLEQTLETIEEANKHTRNDVFRYTVGTKAVLYKPKRILL